MERPYFIGIFQLLQGFKKKFLRRDLGLKGPVIFGQIGTNIVKQELFWIKNNVFDEPMVLINEETCYSRYQEN